MVRLALFLWASLSFVGAARAQDRVPAERFRPSLDRNGIFDVEAGEVSPHLAYDVAVWLGYANDPLVLYRNGERASVLVAHRYGGSLVGAIGIMDWLELGVEAPFVLYQGLGGGAPDGLPRFDRASGAAFGDLRFVPKLRILSALRHGLDLAFLVGTTVPTGVPRSAFSGESGVTATPELALSARIVDLRLAANVGYKIRGTSELASLEVGSEITYRAGAALNLEPLIAAPLEAALTLSGSTPSSAPFVNFNQNPLELLAGATYEGVPDWQLFAALGAGVRAGYGTPDFRAIAGVRYSPRAPDKDKDRIADARDVCPDGPEDFDGFQDDDGCAEPDNDDDGLLDDEDKCPSDAEVQNGFEDDDGCPDEVPPAATLAGSKIAITEKVLFTSGKAVIERRSYPVLAEVAELLKKNPQITRVRIEGHTDNQGDAARNLKLSQERASAVRDFLIGRGVSDKVLEAEGYGETIPIAPNKSPRGREQNRRVEFTILEVEGASRK